MAEYYWLEKQATCTLCNGNKEIPHPFWVEYLKALDQGTEESQARASALEKYGYLLVFEVGQLEIPLDQIENMHPRDSIVTCIACNGEGDIVSKVSLQEALAAIGR